MDVKKETDEGGFFLRLGCFCSFKKKYTKSKNPPYHGKPSATPTSKLLFFLAKFLYKNYDKQNKEEFATDKIQKLWLNYNCWQ